MGKVTIRDIGSVGEVNDLPSHELPPHVWSETLNVRCRDTHAEPIRGETEVFTQGTIVTDPICIFPCAKLDGTLWWVYGGEDKIGVCNVDEHVDITPAATTLTADGEAKWTGTWLNGIFLMNSPNEELLVWDDIDPDTPILMKRMSAITDTEFESTWRFNSLRAFKEILIGIGFTDDGAEYPTTVKWSGPATAGTVPIEWDSANVNNIANERPLSATRGRAVDGMQLGNAFIICKEDATVRADFGSGTIPLVFDYLDNTSGVLALNCMVEFQKGKMLILNQNADLMVTDGVYVTSILQNRVRKKLQRELDYNKRHQCFLSHNPLKREVWVCYPTTDGGINGARKALVWNYESGAITFTTLGRLTHIAFGENAIDSALSAQTIDSVTTVIDNTYDIIDASSLGYRKVFVGCSHERGAIYQLDVGEEVDGVKQYSYLKRENQAIAGQSYDGAIRVDHTMVKVCSGVWPVVNTNAFETLEVDVKVGGSIRRKASEVIWEGYYTYTVGTNQWLDFFMEGVYLSFEFKIDSSKDWIMHGYTLQIAEAGELF